MQRGVVGGGGSVISHDSHNESLLFTSLHSLKGKSHGVFDLFG